MKGHSKGKRFRELGKSLPVPEQEALVRGALISNIQEGEDKAIQSIKALGEHSGPGNVPAGNTNRHRRTQPAAIGHRPQGGDSERARGAMKREVCVQSDQLHESTVTGQAKRQSEEEQEQLLDELIRRLRLTLASCESLAAVMRPICQLAHEWACGHQLSGGRRRRTKRMRNNETVVNGQVKLFGRPGGRTDRPCHARVYTRAIRSFYCSAFVVPTVKGVVLALPFFVFHNAAIYTTFIRSAVSQSQQRDS
jgi:hypothetical protein